MGLHPWNGKGPQADAMNTGWWQLLPPVQYFTHADPLQRLITTSSWVDLWASGHQEGPNPC